MSGAYEYLRFLWLELQHAVDERFVRAEHRALLIVAETPDELLLALDQQDVPTLPKWMDRETT